MKVLVLNGSPKVERSNTMNITNSFVDGFPENTEVQRVNIYKSNILPCVGCFSCWGKTQGSCVIKDDMQKIYNLIFESDVIIVSFPLYFFGMPSQVKAFTDRCLPLMMPYQGNRVDNEKASFHELRDKSMLEKRFVIISSCGYVDADNMYPALTKQLDLIFGEGHYTSIYCPEGELFIAKQAKRQREGYLSDIKKAGEEYSKNLCLSEETMKIISKPILSPKGFEKITSEHWLKLH